jgi:hypothetical protein
MALGLFRKEAAPSLAMYLYLQAVRQAVSALVAAGAAVARLIHPRKEFFFPAQLTQ